MTNTVKLECHADNYRDAVSFEVSYEWLHSKVGDVESYTNDALFSDNDEIFDLASKENQIISIVEIKDTENLTEENMQRA